MTTTSSEAFNAARHVPVDIVEAYHSQSVGGVLVVAGMPPGRVQIAPHLGKLSVLVQSMDNVAGPDLREHANLRYDLHEEGGVMWHRLDVDYDDNLTEAYPVLCTILDRIQLHGESFKGAVEAVLAGLGDILAGRGGLSHEKQVGLFGELLVLLSLAQHLTPHDAVSAWRGPDREEHDFGLFDSDVEVKTTMSEQRSHWISGLTQLMPTPGRDLHLLSLQITAAGQGPGTSLAQFVEMARTLPGIPTGVLDSSLASSGYYARHADLYQSRWTLRTIPTFHLIDDDFPALTPGRISSSVPSPRRITDVRYRVDLDGLPTFDPLFAVTLTGAVTS